MRKDNGNRTKTSALLWTMQGGLAALFLFAGMMKLVMPIEMFTEQMPLPGSFIRFIGIAETLVDRKELHGDEVVELLDAASLEAPHIDVTDEAIWPKL